MSKNFRIENPRQILAETVQELGDMTRIAEMEVRDYDGGANNYDHPVYGRANTPLLRKAGHAYADGISSLAVRGPNNPNPRTVSNEICKQTGSIPNELGLSSMMWGWGQFLDHVLDLTDANPAEPINVVTPLDDEFPSRTILINRSLAVPLSVPREQPNAMSSYVDASAVYGAVYDRAYALRRLDGSGKLKTSVADNGEILPPYNLTGLPNAPNTSSSLFLCGDVRVNENILLTSMHTLFVREHNRLCDRFASEGSEERIYQKARRYVSALIQVITYREFLPALLGDNFIESYTGYDPTVNVGINTEFSAAAFRVGHTMLTSIVKVSGGVDVALRDAFFTPSYNQIHGVDALLKGTTELLMQKIDGKVVEDIRSFLFGPPNAQNLLDLVVLNIQRARDHGIPGYNAVRNAYGLSSRTFAQITSDVAVQTKLQTLYGSPDHIDPWIGVVVEDHLPGKAVGELLFTIVSEQFRRLRNGDRFWYEYDQFMSGYVAEINNTKLSDVINRNCSVVVKSDVFRV